MLRNDHIQKRGKKVQNQERINNCNEKDIQKQQFLEAFDNIKHMYSFNQRETCRVINQAANLIYYKIRREHKGKLEDIKEYVPDYLIQAKVIQKTPCYIQIKQYEKEYKISTNVTNIDSTLIYSYLDNNLGDWKKEKYDCKRFLFGEDTVCHIRKKNPMPKQDAVHFLMFLILQEEFIDCIVTAKEDLYSKKVHGRRIHRYKVTKNKEIMQIGFSYFKDFEQMWSLLCQEYVKLNKIVVANIQECDNEIQIEKENTNKCNKIIELKQTYSNMKKHMSSCMMEMPNFVPDKSIPYEFHINNLSHYNVEGLIEFLKQISPEKYNDIEENIVGADSIELSIKSNFKLFDELNTVRENMLINFNEVKSE